MARYIEIEEKKVKQLKREAQQFQDDITCAVGTDFMQKIAEAENKTIFEIIKTIENSPTADVVPRSEVEQLQRNLEQCENGYNQQIHLLQCKHKDEVEELTKENESLAKSVNEASELIRKLRSENNRLKAYDEERDIQLHQRLVREAKQEVAKEIISEFKNMVVNYMKDRDLLLVAFKNAVEYAETELKKKYIGKDTDVPTKIGEQI